MSFQTGILLEIQVCCWQCRQWQNLQMWCSLIVICC